MPTKHIGTGTAHAYPNKVNMTLPGSRTVHPEIPMGQAPMTRCEMYWDFIGAVPTFTLPVALTTDGGVHEQATTGNNSNIVRVPRGGVLVAARLIAEDALAANDTNYLTFTVVNKLGSGSGTTAMLAATDANTTKATGGVAIAAFAGRDLTVHGTAANLNVAAGDIIQVTEAVTGTLANAVDKPTVELVFATVDLDLTPRITRTAGSPLVRIREDIRDGVARLELSATNEVNFAGLDFDDQLLIPANARVFFECRLKLPSGPAANTRAVAGVAAAHNATLDSNTKHLWWRFEGNNDSILFESDDGTTDDDDNDSGLDQTDDTYLTLSIDATGGVHAVEYYVNNNHVGTLAASALAASDLLQVYIGIQKDSGTGTEEVDIDKIRVEWDIG